MEGIFSGRGSGGSGNGDFGTDWRGFCDLLPEAVELETLFVDCDEKHSKFDQNILAFCAILLYNRSAY
jgi:hypothetical protein